MAVIQDEDAFRRWWHRVASDDQRSLLARISAEDAPVPTEVLDELSTAGVTDATAPWPATQDDPAVYLSPALRGLIAQTHHEQ